MKITYTGRHTEFSQDMKDYFEKRMKKIKFYYEQIMIIETVLEIQRGKYSVEVKLSANHDFFVASAASASWQEAMDGVTDKIETEVKKKRDKITEHKGPAKEGPAQAE